MKAQNVKNAVIVPSGAKGGFVAKCISPDGTREEIMKEVEKSTGVKAEEILSRSQRRHIAAARASYCYLAKERCGVSGASLMKQLRMSSGGVTRLFYKGKELSEVRR